MAAVLLFSHFIKIKSNFLICHAFFFFFFLKIASGKSAYLGKIVVENGTNGTGHVDMIMINNKHTRSQGFLC